jgi:NAD(P)-dependent dehydrogenase (short-subunit alcohol dehydrogenase family)
VYPALTLKNAGLKRNEAARAAAKGTSPAKQRQLAKVAAVEAVTVAEFGERLFWGDPYQGPQGHRTLAHGLRRAVLRLFRPAIQCPVHTTKLLQSRVAATGLAIDILINNAGFGTDGAFETIAPLSCWFRSFRTANVLAPRLQEICCFWC